MEADTDIEHQQRQTHPQKNPASQLRKRRTRSEPDLSSGKTSDQWMEAQPDQQRCRSIMSSSSQNRQQILQSEPSSHQSLQNLDFFEWKYRQALKSIEKGLTLNTKSSVLQELQREMLNCFQFFRQQLIISIKARKKYALTQKSKLHETQKKRLEQELKMEQQRKNQVLKKYSQSLNLFQDAINRNDSQQGKFEKYMKSRLIEHNICKENVDKLECALRRLEDKTVTERLEISREHDYQLEKKLSKLDKQREKNEKIKKIIEERAKERRRAENCAPLNQPAFQQKFLQKLFKLQESIRSQEISTKSIQEEYEKLKALYKLFKDNLTNTIKTQKKLQGVDEQLEGARKSYHSALQQYSNIYLTQDPNKEKCYNIVEKLERAYDNLLSLVNKLDVQLDTLDKNAKRKERLGLEQLQSMLKRLEDYRDFQVDIEKKILQREQLLAQLEEVKKQKRQFQDQHLKILKNLLNAQEQELSDEEIYRLRSTSRELKEKLKGLGPKTKRIQEFFKKL